MSSQPLWLRDLAAYSIQAGALVVVGAIMARLLRLRVPNIRLAYWQGLLALCLFLPLLQPWRPEVLESSGAVLSDITVAASAAGAGSLGWPLAEIILLLICAGMAVRAVWIALGLGRLWLYRRHAQRLDEVPQTVADARRLVPVSPAIFISSELQTPATFGWFRPTVLFPTRFPEMEHSMQKAIALHEFLHVERRDWLWNMLEEAVLTVLWFHLPLWWVVRSARLSREQVVDAEAIRRSRARRPYLKALLEMAGQQSLAETLPAPLFLRESQLAERVALMMKEVHMSHKRLSVSILTATTALLVVGASVVWAFPLKTSARSLAPEASSAVSSSESGAEAVPSPSRGVPGAQAEGGQTSVNVRLHKAGGKRQAPHLIYKQEPRYTRQAKEKRVEGTLKLLCTIDAKGTVTEVTELSKPLGAGLDESAMKAVRNWKFEPATLDGKPVPVKARITVNFKLSKKSGKASHKSSSALDPPPQAEQGSSEVAKPSTPPVKINQVEIQRQVEQAMKQAKTAQQAAEKLNSAEMQRQLKQALEQAKVAQESASKIDQANIRRQIEEAMKQAKAAQQAAPKIDQAKIQEQIDQAMKQLKMAQITAPKIDEAQIQQQIAKAIEQAKIAQQAAEKIDKGEIQRQLQQARRQLEQAQKQAEKARQEASKARKELEKQRKEVKPLHAEPPKPPSPSSLEPAPPPVLPSPPAPPSPPQNE